MRIGFYHDDLPVPGRKPPGVAIFVHRLARELSARGHQVTLWTRSAAPADANYRHVRLWPHLHSNSKLLRTFLVSLLHNAVNWRDVEVLHFHGDDWLMLDRSLPTVRTLYGSAIFEARHATSSKRRAFQGVIAGLEYLSARLATSCYGIGPGAPAFYPTVGNFDMGVDIPAQVSLEREEQPTILFVGTWAGRKRGELLHRVFLEHVLPRVPAAELWMVSDRCRSATGVRCLGSPSDDELLCLYRRAWVMCHPSTYEGFGIPYLEAMANGVPIVSSPNPGAQYVLGDDLAAASIVPDRELGPALVSLLTDAAARRQRIEQGRRRVSQFSWDAVVERHVEAYRLAVAQFLRTLGPREDRDNPALASHGR
jgi:glycosyltransferase involved in cell wall biosynthesis